MHDHQSPKSGLLPVPPPSRSVCRTCRSTMFGGDGERCGNCRSHRERLGGSVLDHVGFTALVQNDRTPTGCFYGYKGQRSRPCLNQLVAMLAAWLRHETCFDQRPFDVVAPVPSTQGRVDHPINEVVGTVFGGRFTPLLAPSGSGHGRRDVAAERFTPTRDVTDGRVLVVDDAWVTGARLQSAGAALKQAGAGTVAGVAIARWVDITFAGGWIEFQQFDAWTAGRCSACHGRNETGSGG